MSRLQLVITMGSFNKINDAARIYIFK